MTEGFVVAVVGATGAAGSTLLQILRERRFPVGELRLFASERSAGTRVEWGEQQLDVRVVAERELHGSDVVFFAAGAATSRQFAPRVAASGGLAVGKSSAFRMEPAVPLVVPEVNADSLRGNAGIVANPNCMTIPLSLTLAPLHRAFGLRHVTLATYQAASGAGRALVDELDLQAATAARGDRPAASVYPHVLHGNVVPGGWSVVGDEMEEEVKIAAETRRVLGLPQLRIAVTTVRVAVRTGHSAAVWVECEEPVDPGAARVVFRAAPGLTVVDDPAAQQYPTPRDAAGTDAVLVGRIRSDSSRDNGISFFFASDNLRRGAATNAVMVAELALQLGP